MSTRLPSFPTPPRARLACAIAVAALASACGNTADPESSGGAPAVAKAAIAQAPAALATGTTTLSTGVDPQADAAASQLAQPAFYAAPLLLDEPADVDPQDGEASVRRGPRRQPVPGEFANLSPKRLTRATLETARVAPERVRAREGESGASAPMAAGTMIATYSPAQIRAAYGFPALPAAGTTLTATQAAQLGSGQTIYIVNARHDPNIVAELAAFNAKFGLPACTTRAIATNSALPLPAPAAGKCEFSVVYTTAAGAMTSTAPAYDSGWAMEIALDVQWAHATAPLARIVLIEAPDPSVGSLANAVKLANAMGPGAVSMSFGAPEGAWTSSVESAFSGASMTYLAATGDSGAGVYWPSVSPKVVAVGGTTLAWSGSGARSETGWSGTGGGASAFTPVPTWQNNAVPGMWTSAGRIVADVAFNADPSTGQYVAVIPPGSSTASWMSVGGTSLSTPQWAGLVAMANALRATGGKAVLGSPHAVLYGQVAAVPGTYASTFADIVKGSDGTCVTCAAKTGFDQLTGLGTPNVTSLLGALSGASAPATPPVVGSASITGTVGTALTFTVSASAPNAMTFSLAGAPSGMTIGTTGVVSWPKPVAGSWSVTVTAKDAKTGLSGSGVYKVTVAQPAPPTVGGTTISGRPGTPLSFTVSTSSANPVTYTLAGAPKGMTVGSTGVVGWASPVLGTYAVTVTVKDTKTGLSGSGVYTVKIANAGPVITAAAMTGVAGKALTGTISISDPGATWLSVSISGVPLGMSFSMTGTTVTASWPSPVTGSYSLSVTVVDQAGLSARATIPVTIAAK